MGCASSCRTFENFSTALEWLAKTYLDIPLIIHLLDDFFLVSPTFSGCQAHLSNFLSFCEFLGIPMAPDKTIGPSCVLSFRGIELDSMLMEACLPRDKISKCMLLLEKFLYCKKVTLRELQSLIGLLNFACSVIVPGRAFLRRLIDLTMGHSKPQHFIRLTQTSRADLRICHQFLCDFHGRSFFLDDVWLDSEVLHLYTDASGSLGFGAIFGTQWFCGRWADRVSISLSVLEFFPFLLSILIWGGSMRNRRILFFTDNEALVHVINRSSFRNPRLMFFVRHLVLACLHYNILFRARHVPGVHNQLADSLSRLQVQRFRKLATQYVQPIPTVIPLTLQPQSWQI